MPVERPILFNGDMVRAILDGAKTQTRRVVKATKGCTVGTYTYGSSKVEPVSIDMDGDPWDTIRCPYGKPGHRLWVRETWSIDPSEGDVTYDADCATKRFLDLGPEGIVGKPGKHPSIFMPRALSRITLEVTGVRVERVQDITAADALAEGVTPVAHGTDPGDAEDAALWAFERLWESINAKRGYGWEANLWVWVVEFKVAGKLISTLAEAGSKDKR